MAPQILIIGHIVKDLTSDGWRPGGGALYAAAQALKLGAQVRAVSACGPGSEPGALLPGAEWQLAPTPQEIVFENSYTKGGRSQRVLSRGRPLTLGDIPEKWLDAPVVLFAPVFHDIDEALPQALALPDRLVGLAAQGWLRHLDGDRVHAAPVEPRPDWLRGDVVFVSDEDVSNPEAVAGWQASVPVVVLTRAAFGCSVWDTAGRHDVAPVATHEVDPTGAGDVFATAFLLRYHETGDAVEAAHFGSAAAALAIAGEGIEGLASRTQIEDLLSQERQAKSA